MFPLHPLRSRPRTKFAVLQRMLVTPPWDRFDLSVMLFSAEAESWWNEAKQGQWPGGPNDPVKRQKKTALGQSVEIQKQLDLPKLDLVKVTVRIEGVDGNRLERERTGVTQSHESGAGIGPIMVDDYDLLWLNGNVG